jgi:hypothetical protein
VHPIALATEDDQFEVGAGVQVGERIAGRVGRAGGRSEVGRAHLTDGIAPQFAQPTVGVTVDDVL